MIAELHKKIATAEAEADLVAGLRRWRQSGGGWHGDRLANPRWYNLLLDAWEAASHAGDYNDNGYAEACVAEYLAEFRELTKPQEAQA